MQNLLLLIAIAINSSHAFLFHGTSQRRLCIHQAKKKGKSSGKKQTAQYYELEPDGSDAWRADRVVDVLRQGGMGVLPTDTCYSFVTSIDSKEGVERILRIKGEEKCKKPLSLMCADISTIDKYTFGLDKQMFKILKKNLPGPYTFILPASSELPKLFFFNPKGKMKASKRATVGCRIPNDVVALSVLSQLDGPLLVSSVPTGRGSEEEDFDTDDDDDEEDGEDEDEDEGGNSDSAVQRRRERELDEWRRSSSGEDAVSCLEEEGARWTSGVDFIVDCGTRPTGGSTIFDLSTNEDPVLIRVGRGGDSISM